MADKRDTGSGGLARFWNDPIIRSRTFQILTALVVIYFLWTIYQNTIINMERRGITTGFAFLGSPAGFGIVMSLIPYDETMSYGRTFYVGLLNTLLVSSLGIVAATILGFAIGIGRLSKNWLVSTLSAIFVDTFRNIPLLLQIFFWYFAVLRNLPSPRDSMEIGEMFFLNNRGVYMPAPIPEEGFWLVVAVLCAAIVGAAVLYRWARKRQDATGQLFPAIRVGLAMVLLLPSGVFLLAGSPLGWDVPELRGFNFRGGVSMIPELGALFIALTVYTASFIAEIVRSGIQSVSHGQTEAASALGLRRGTTLRLVIIPQAMRVIIPPLTSQYLNLTKNSSLAVAIGYPDLVAVFMGTTLNQTGQAVEVVAITMLVYLSISLLISLLMNVYNKAMALKER
ncbi:MAG TPA: amino acid ABC transporter permease [Rhodocyclaceae bacterium]|jgi:general L-amino acid transport system permease protein|nr:amino acid ABC transporter permease [Rhodocyclaceae bacterium]HRQ46801.1 amino acid ABC transporter permease [Rhodocyclaceae bacterium]